MSTMKYKELISQALLELNEKNGTSTKGILEYAKSKHGDQVEEKKLKAQLKKMLKDGHLLQCKNSFKLANPKAAQEGKKLIKMSGLATRPKKRVASKKITSAADIIKKLNQTKDEAKSSARKSTPEKKKSASKSSPSKSKVSSAKKSATKKSPTKSKAISKSGKKKKSNSAKKLSKKKKSSKAGKKRKSYIKPLSPSKSKEKKASKPSNGLAKKAKRTTSKSSGMFINFHFHHCSCPMLFLQK